jgi:hypothetical protein
MNETMREYLKRRQRWYVGAFIIGLALVIVPNALGNILGREQLHEHHDLYVFLRLAGIAVLVGSSMLTSRVKCPKCNKPLSTGSRWSKVPAFCPNCGVNFDEPLPHNPIS